jgi:hypothetical protein
MCIPAEATISLVLLLTTARLDDGHHPQVPCISAN